MFGRLRGEMILYFQMSPREESSLRLATFESGIPTKPDSEDFSSLFFVRRLP